MGYKVYDMRVKHYERLRGEIGLSVGWRVMSNLCANDGSDSNG